MRQLTAEPKVLRFVWGGIALFIYTLFIGLLLFYFNHRQSEKPKHFVKKNDKHITLASVSPDKIIHIKTIVKKTIKPKKVPQKQTKKIELPKIKHKIVNDTKVIPPKKKVLIKEKIVKQKSIKKKNENKKKPIKVKSKKENKPKVKKVENVKIKKTADLFSSVKTKITEPKKPVHTSSKRSDSGIENAYFSKVQNLLETWPAQSEYAGEKAMVRLYVKPTGLFEFKVKSQSDNVAFNLGLIDFLMQLQKLGLGTHKGGKIYEFQVEFIAKE